MGQRMRIAAAIFATAVALLFLQSSLKIEDGETREVSRQTVRLVCFIQVVAVLYLAVAR